MSVWTRMAAAYARRKAQRLPEMQIAAVGHAEAVRETAETEMICKDRRSVAYSHNSAIPNSSSSAAVGYSVMWTRTG
jgi:hypothetical protein